VFPKKKEKFETFLHLLFPCDRDKGSPPAAEGFTTKDLVMKGVCIDDWLVLFGQKDIFNQKIIYSIKNKGQTANLLLGMTREKPYTLIISENGSESKGQRVVTSKEGTLFFKANGPCHIEIVPL
jgi:hypothetical protein